MPDEVQDVFGAALLDAQYGDRHPSARPFGEGLRGIMKIIEDYEGDTYRVAYTVEFEQCVYVLHVFKKKSKTGIATPKPDIDLIRRRQQAAAEHYRATYERKNQP